MSAATLDEMKRLAARVLQIHDDAPLQTLEVYEVFSQLRGANTRMLREIVSGLSDEMLAEIDHRARLKSSLAKRKHAGTGYPDTSEETWEQMRVAYLAGENLRSLARRFGVLYTSALKRAYRWRRRAAQQIAEVIQLFPQPQPQGRQ